MKVQRMVFMGWVTIIVLAVLLGGTTLSTPVLGSTSAASGNVELVGQIGGSTRTVAVQGNYAYIGVGPRLVVLDISKAAQPAVAGQTEVLAGVVQAVKVVGNYAYVMGEGAGLYVIDIAAPAAPVQVGFAGLTGEVTGMAVTGNYAYVVGPEIGLHIFHLTNPAAPSEVGSYQVLEGATRVDVAGNYAYVAANDKGLRIINIGHPAAPTEAGSYQLSAWWARDVKVRGDYAYVAAYNGLRIINITNPATPTEVGSYAMQANKIAIAGNFAYLIGEDGVTYGLRIVNIANPDTPQAVGFYPIPGWTGDNMIAVDMAAADNYVYLAQKPVWNPDDGRYLSGGLHLINVATPPTPTQASFYATTGAFTEVAVAGSYAYAIKNPVGGSQNETAGGLNIFDITHPTIPTEAGAYYPPRERVQAVTVINNYAYIGDLLSNDNFVGGRLRIVNISNPAAPTYVGSHSTLGAVQDIAVVGSYAYLAETPGFRDNPNVGGGLRIFNIANPAVPIQIGYFAIPEGAATVVVAGNYAYLVSRDEWLWIINIAKPAAPTRAGLYTAHHVRDVAVAGNYAYLATGDNGLRIVNITNPAAPTEVGSYGSGIVEAVAVAGDYAYLAVENGLGIVKITHPTVPTEAGFYDPPGFALDVAVANNYIYVANGDGGLLILRFTAEPEASANPLYLPIIWKN